MPDEVVIRSICVCFVCLVVIYCAFNSFNIGVLCVSLSHFLFVFNYLVFICELVYYWRMPDEGVTQGDFRCTMYIVHVCTVHVCVVVSFLCLSVCLFICLYFFISGVRQMKVSNKETRSALAASFVPFLCFLLARSPKPTSSYKIQMQGHPIHPFLQKYKGKYIYKASQILLAFYWGL